MRAATQRRLRTHLEVSAGHPHVVLLARVVELRQAPVDQSQSPVLVVDHHVVRLDVAVHDAHAVTVVKGTQQLVEVATDIVVSQGLVLGEIRMPATAGALSPDTAA